MQDRKEIVQLRRRMISEYMQKCSQDMKATQTTAQLRANGRIVVDRVISQARKNLAAKGIA